MFERTVEGGWHGSHLDDKLNEKPRSHDSAGDLHEYYLCPSKENSCHVCRPLSLFDDHKGRI